MYCQLSVCRHERLSAIVALAAKAWVLWAAIKEDREGRALRFRRKAAAVLIAARYKARVRRREQEQMANKTSKVGRPKKWGPNLGFGARQQMQQAAPRRVCAGYHMAFAAPDTDRRTCVCP